MPASSDQIRLRDELLEHSSSSGLTVEATLAGIVEVPDGHRLCIARRHKRPRGAVRDGVDASRNPGRHHGKGKRRSLDVGDTEALGYDRHHEDVHDGEEGRYVVLAAREVDAIVVAKDRVSRGIDKIRGLCFADHEQV